MVPLIVKNFHVGANILLWDQYILSLDENLKATMTQDVLILTILSKVDIPCTCTPKFTKIHPDSLDQVVDPCKSNPTISIQQMRESFMRPNNAHFQYTSVDNESFVYETAD